MIHGHNRYVLLHEVPLQSQYVRVVVCMSGDLLAPMATRRLRGICIRYTTWVKTCLINAICIDHFAEGAGMVVISLLFLFQLSCIIGREWSSRT